MRYVIHIGMHKTGSTTIQKYLQANWEGYARQGVEIPDFSGKRGPKTHRAVFAHFGTQPSGAVADWLGQAPGDAVRLRVISCEGFWGATPGSIGRLRKAVGKQATIIAFIRDPVEHAASHCAQLMKKKFSVASLADYLAATRPVRGSGTYYDYDETLRRWGGSFADLRTLHYNGEDSVAAFLQAAQLPAIERPRRPRAQNLSMPPVCTAVLQRINQMLLSGALPEAQAVQAKAAVRGNPEACTQLFHPHARFTSVDTSEFAAAFVEANPVSATRFALRGGPVPWVSAIELDDVEFIRVLAQCRAWMDPGSSPG